MMNDIQRLGACVPKIAEWFRLNGRHFAWRDAPTPYHIWVSEIMLQQTRIEAVIAYYDRFVAALPDIRSLSQVPDDVLMKLWQGLGYYSRARNLKKAAQTVMSDYHGHLPQSAEELKKLPGIGDYTAGAIASIAMNRPSPAVDGNVLRVVMRILGQYDDVMLDATKKKVYAALKQVYPERSNEASLLTQGLMELGEVLCIPNGTPACEHCPVQGLCTAYAQNLTEQLPVRNVKTKRKIEEKTVLLLQYKDTYALSKRPEKGLLAGLWEFPNESGVLTEEEIIKKYPQAERVGFLGNAKHIFTHIEWHLTCYRVMLSVPAQDFVWANKNEIQSRYAVPGAFGFVLKHIGSD